MCGTVAGRQSVECIVSAKRVCEVAEELVGGVLEGPSATPGLAVALDCEGVRLGRFGRICLVQLAVPGGRLFLFDALRPGVVEALAPLLESTRVEKVLHDCREDSTALYHQHGVELRRVFDTQAVQAALERHAGRPARQAPITELLRTKLGVAEPEEQAEMKQLMMGDAKLWASRPLTRMLVRYALHGVVHLLPLRAALLEEASSSGIPFSYLAHASDRAVEYRLLNREFPSAASMAKIGTRLWALVAARTDLGVYFKLNAGRVGLSSTPSAIARFKDVELGDAVLCCVSGVSLDGTYLYLDRYDHDWDYFDHQLRPSGEPEVGTYGREHRHWTSLLPGASPVGSLDPLLLRGLPASGEPEGADGFDAWEAGPEDLGQPIDLEY